jgi:hypothetical protein
VQLDDGLARFPIAMPTILDGQSLYCPISNYVGEPAFNSSRRTLINCGVFLGSGAHIAVRKASISNHTLLI